MEWDGRGLPPVAAARVARARESGVRTSLLSAAGATSLQSVGFDTVGEVMGCTVENVGWQGYRGCGAGFGLASNIVIGPQAPIGTRDNRWAPFRPYAEGIRRGYATALSRLEQEAAALGADGVVGIRLSLSHLDNAREFVALGTAVRARSTVRPPRPFTTDLAGSDVAKLLGGRWVPARLVVCFDVAVRHDDWRTQNQASFWNAGNTEVTGYTELTQYVRHTVREDVDDEVRRLGADGFLSSAITLRIFEIEPSESHRDHVAEALMTGTAIVRIDRRGLSGLRGTAPPQSPRPAAVPVLSLSDLAPRRNRP